VVAAMQLSSSILANADAAQASGSESR